MNTTDLTRKLVAEALGTALLIAAVIGSGIMATNLTNDVGVQLTMNALSTIFALGTLIWWLGPVSGAHFNPAVTLVAAARKELSWATTAAYIPAQIAGGLFGTLLANTMFSLPAWHASTKLRDTPNLWLGEIIATAGLIIVIGALPHLKSEHLAAVLVPAWIGAAYFFTSSTSFANPAVTIARAASDSFAGIAPSAVPMFIVAQLIGAAIGAAIVVYLKPTQTTTTPATELETTPH